MITALQNLRSFFFISFVLLIGAGCSAPLKIEENKDVRSTTIVPFESDYMESGLGRRTIPLDDGGFAVLRDADDKLKLDRYATDLTLVWSATFENDDDEELGRLIGKGKNLIILSQIESENDTRQAIARSIDLTTGALIKEAIVFETPVDVDLDPEYFYITLSGDSSEIMLHAWGEQRDIDLPGDRDYPINPLYAVVIDLELNVLHARSAQILRSEVDGKVLRWVGPGLNGEIDVLFLREDSFGPSVVFQRFESGKEGPTIGLEQNMPVPKERKAHPQGLLVDRLMNDRIVAVTAQQVGDRFERMIRIDVDPAQKSLRTTAMTEFTTEVALRVTKEDEEIEDYALRAADVTPDGRMTLILERYDIDKSTTLEGRTVFDADFEQLLALRFDSVGAMIGSALVDRDESWQSEMAANYEGHFVYRCEGDRLQLLVRETEYDGVRLYDVDLTTGMMVPRLILPLADPDVIFIDYTLWLSDDSLVLWAKSGMFFETFGEWSIVKVVL